MYPIFDPIKKSPQEDTPDLDGIKAYTNLISVKQGDTISFCVWIQNEQDFTRTICDFNDQVIDTQTGHTGQQNTNSEPYMNGCGWQPITAVDYTVPLNLPSGVYKAKFRALVDNYEWHCYFIVKSLNPGINAKILCISSVNTWEAYNLWGGKSLYGDEPNWIFENRSFRVSFNRPQRTYDYERWELPFIQWLANNGYIGVADGLNKVEFCTNVDIHADPSIVTNYKLAISIGHDEYWSWEMRNTLENFISNNGNVAFFSSNVCWWQIRFESQADGPGNQVPNRVIVCYKDVNLDPYPDPQRKTINWFEQTINRPENLMTGVSYYWGNALWSYYPTSYKTSLQRHWLLKNTGLIDRQSFGADLFNCFETDAADFADADHNFPIPTGKLAYETSQFSAPKDLMILASANLTNLGEGITGYWCGPNYHNGWCTMGVYRKPSGGFVFHGGNYNWAMIGLAQNEFHQITKNVLDIFGIDFITQAFLLVNPGFESWDTNHPPNYEYLPTQWYRGGGTGSITIGPAYEGTRSVSIDATNSETFLFQAYIPIRTNRQYRISCYAKPGSTLGPGGGTGISIRLETLDQYSLPLQEFIIAEYPTGASDWQPISNQGMLSSTDNIMIQARVKVHVKAGQSACFDNVVVEEL